LHTNTCNFIVIFSYHKYSYTVFFLSGVNIFLDLKNVSDEEEANMSDVLQQLFEEAILKDKGFKSRIPAGSYVTLRGAIEKTFKRFLSKGWRITRVKHECIQLHIECANFTALAALFREQTQGLIDQQLTELNEALTECVSEKMLLLETTIYTDELWNVIDKASKMVVLAHCNYRSLCLCYL
jgi:hypothetical protein